MSTSGSNTEKSASSSTGRRRISRAGAFDIRVFIASLIGIYGVVLVIVGLFFTGEAALARGDGLNINLYAGIGMVVVAALFLVWARLRPVFVPPDKPDQSGTPK